MDCQKELTEWILERYKDRDVPLPDKICGILEELKNNSSFAEEFTLQFLVLTDNLKILKDFEIKASQIGIITILCFCERGAKVVFQNDFIISPIAQILANPLNFLSKSELDMSLYLMNIIIWKYVRCSKKKWKRLLKFKLLENLFLSCQVVLYLKSECSTDDGDRCGTFLLQEVMIANFRSLNLALQTKDPKITKQLIKLLEKNHNWFFALFPKLLQMKYKRIGTTAFTMKEIKANFISFLTSIACVSERLCSLIMNDSRLISSLLKGVDKGFPNNQDRRYQSNESTLLHILRGTGSKENLDTIYHWVEDEYNLKMPKRRISENDMKNIHIWCGFSKCRKNGVDATLKLCSGCELIRYCSKECQRKDWKSHKLVCAPLTNMQM